APSTDAAPAGSVFAKVEPAKVTVYLKNVVELRLQAAVAASTASTQCLVRGPDGPGQDAQFVELKKDGQAVPQGRLSLLGDCGVRVRNVNWTDDGTWTLSAKYDDVGTATAEARVTVKDFQGGVLPELPSVDEGAPLRLHLTGGSVELQPLKSCAVVTPRGEAVPLAPDAKEGRVQYDAEGGSLADGWCGLKVGEAQARDDGPWVLEAVESANGTVYRGKTSVTVFLPKMTVQPKGPVYVEVGDEATLALQFAQAPAKDPDWKVCSVKSPAGVVVQVAGEGAADQAQDAGVALVGLAEGRCAVRVTLSDAKADTGYWTISAGPDKDSLRAADVRIFVKEPYVPVGGKVKVAVGAVQALLTCGVQTDEVLTCELKDPAGRLAATLAGPCFHKLDRVRVDHRGKWTCTLVLNGYTQAASDYVQVDLDEPARADLAVAWDGGGAVTLKCVVSGCALGARYCRMVAPDGASVMLKEAVSRQGSQGEYAYAGAGFAKCDCSMRIAAPRDRHFGVWRCYVGGKDSRVLGGLIHLNKQNTQDTRPARSHVSHDLEVVPFTVPATGLVRPGTVMTVGCRAQRALSYCYLRTPLGQQLLLSEKTPVYGLYGGDGLAFGDCAVRMAMTANHSGTWRCGVGIVHTDDSLPAMDEEVDVQVTVSESLAVPVEANVTAFAGSTATLACRTVLGEAIQYCRFHMPDGSSIHLADAQSTAEELVFPYQYAGAGGAAAALRGGYCGVNISLVRDMDFGPWTCVVALVGDAYGTEYTADLTLQLRESDAVVSVDAALTGMAVALATVVLGGAAFLVYQRYYRRPRPASAESIPLDDAQSVSSSPGLARTSSRARATRTAATRTMTTRALGATMQTSHLPARTARTRTRSGRRGSQAETAAADFSDSSQDVEYEQSPRTARKSQ
ncbi:uncharacterized protein LOC117647441, partial [Thrips palmi]|uniref:Uncharacterized protein LOC117647441 n=1 Tax=Thrips palmi TaxID=161013 RepID=A0A6P8ZBF5_THRPL